MKEYKKTQDGKVRITETNEKTFDVSDLKGRKIQIVQEKAFHLQKIRELDEEEASITTAIEPK